MDMPLRGLGCIVPPRRARQLDDVVRSPVFTHTLQLSHSSATSICCLIQEAHELGIDPKFGAVTPR
jgi:hypothetical protein